ncbi:MAG: hypothetical protein Q4E67_02040, partial [Planctomycetia bacterium]|nr:hypothetical protein [Planctomycetia bacterium]
QYGVKKVNINKRGTLWFFIHFCFSNIALVFSRISGKMKGGIGFRGNFLRYFVQRKTRDTLL